MLVVAAKYSKRNRSCDMQIRRDFPLWFLLTG